MILVDVHSHLCDNKYDGIEDEIVESFLKNGGEFMINSGFDIPSSVKSAEQAEKYGCVYFSAGVHPDEAKTLDDEAYIGLKEFAKRKKCVGIGEIGFDFHWMKSTEEEQIHAFEKQLELAFELSLPVVIHSRDATQKTLEFLKERKELLKNGFLLHCFGESAEIAKIYVDMGAYFSFGGVITFKNAKKEETIRAVPTDRLLTETDCPYLSPEPFRGQVNEPCRIPLIAKKLAEIKGMNETETEKIIESNFKRFYRI